MDLSAWYPALKLAHVTLVGLSGSLFALRGAAVLAGQGWPMRAAWRHASVVLDTLLLCAGIGLWTLLQLHPLRQPWLGTKLALLVLYIVLGSLALKRARTAGLRAAAYAAALAVFGFMLTVALAHSPWGLFGRW